LEYAMTGMAAYLAIRETGQLGDNLYIELAVVPDAKQAAAKLYSELTGNQAHVPGSGITPGYLKFLHDSGIGEYTNGGLIDVCRRQQLIDMQVERFNEELSQI
jgi:hypothetical protein